MALKFGKRNVLTSEVWRYPLAISGLSGIGKSTVVKEFCEDVVGEDGYLMISCGLEGGLDAITNVNVIKCLEWSGEYDPDTNTMGLNDLIEDIIENKSSDWKDLKIIVFDTADELFASLIEPEVIKMHNREFPQKRTKAFNACFGGFGEAGRISIRLLNEIIFKLKNVNVTPYFILHTKMRTKVDTAGIEYDQLTSALQTNYFEAIRGKIDLLGVCDIDREVVQEKTGRKNIVTKQEELRNRIVDETRFMAFRDNNHQIDSKSRFKYIVDRIPLDAKALRKAMEDAIKMEIEENGGDINQTKKEDEKIAKKLEEKVAKKETELKEIKSDIEGSIEKIISFMKENKSDKEKIAPLLNTMKDDGFSKPMEIDSPETIQKLLDLIEVL